MGFNGASRGIGEPTLEYLLARATVHSDLACSDRYGPGYTHDRFPVFMAGFLKLAYSINDFEETDLRTARPTPVIDRHRSPLQLAQRSNAPVQRSP